MALRAVIDHPKFADLKARLGVPRYVALGCLEALWHFTGRFTPQGNIGKYSDVQIEAWLEWNGEPGALVAALMASRWVDEDPVFRILVHDWPTHADKATKQALNRAKLQFCVPTVHTPGAHNDVLSSLPVPEPVPEPEPEPEPEAKPAVHCLKKTAGREVVRREFDEQWLEFEKTAKQFWPDLIPEDLSSMWFGYRVLDFEQKQMALEILLERIAIGQDPRFVTKKYFDKGEWKRKPLRPIVSGGSQGGGGPSAGGATARAIAEGHRRIKANGRLY